jgi:hypothetical protein
MADGAHEGMSRGDLVSALLRVGLFALLGLLAWWLVDVLLLVFAGVLIAVLLRAPADWLSARTRLSPNLAIAIVFVVLALGLGGVGFAIAPEVSRQFDELTTQVPQAARELTGSLERYGLGPLAARPGPQRRRDGGEARGDAGRRSCALEHLRRVHRSVHGRRRRAVGDAPAAPVHRQRAAPVPDRGPAAGAGDRPASAVSVLQRWLLGSFLSMAIVGVVTWIGLWALGIPLALVLALFAGAMVFIPNFGPLLSAIPALMLALDAEPADRPVGRSPLRRGPDRRQHDDDAAHPAARRVDPAGPDDVRAGGDGRARRGPRCHRRGAADGPRHRARAPRPRRPPRATNSARACRTRVPDRATRTRARRGGARISSGIDAEVVHLCEDPGWRIRCFPSSS